MEKENCVINNPPQVRNPREVEQTQIFVTLTNTIGWRRVSLYR